MYAHTYIHTYSTVFNEYLALLLGHSLPIEFVHQAVDVCRAQSSDGELLTHQRAAQRNLVYLPT